MIAHKKHKSFFLLLVVAMMILLVAQAASVQAFAAQNDENSFDLSEYQAIIDKVNAEYGTDAHFITAEESAEFGLDMPDARRLGTPEEYETALRAFVEANARESAAATRASARAASQPGYYSGELPLTPIWENGVKVGAFWAADSASPVSRAAAAAPSSEHYWL